MIESASTELTTVTPEPLKKKLVISLAYSGLIYLPVYVAKILGLYEGLEIELVQANGDDNAVLQALDSKDQMPIEGKIYESDIAICDPFSVSDLISDPLKTDTYKDPGDVLIIGCMINKPPIWIYRSYETFDKDKLPNPKGKVQFLDDIEFTKVKRIHCYPSPNTGFLFGIDLAFRGLQKDKRTIDIVELDFNPTKCENGNDNDLILTANLVKIAFDFFKSLDPSNHPVKKVVYTYSTGEVKDELRNFFFTGIVANKKSYEHKSEEIGIFLQGLKKAIAKVSNEDFTPEERQKVKDFIITNAKAYEHIDSTTKADTESMGKIADLILEFASECDFYSKDLSIAPNLYYSTFFRRKKYFDRQEELNFYKYVDLKIVNQINNIKYGFWGKIKYKYQSGIVKFYQTSVGQYIDFLKLNYSEVYSNGLVIFLIGAFILFMNASSHTNDMVYYVLGYIGLIIFAVCIGVTINFYKAFKKQRVLRDFPKIALIIFYTLYISAVGGKILSSFFTHKESTTKFQFEIKLNNKDTTIEIK